MNFTHDTVEQILILRFEGDLIGENHIADLMGIIDNTIENKVTLCAIDISKVRYMNSSGIGILITVLTKFRNKGGEVVLINPSMQVRKLLIITKLNNIFTIVESEGEAIINLKNQAE